VIRVPDGNPARFHERATSPGQGAAAFGGACLDSR